MSRHAVVLCEGYHDRAFWAGWLAGRNWIDARLGRVSVQDPLGRPVTKGKYAFRKGQAFVQLVPCGGWTEIPLAFETELKEARGKRGKSGAIDHLVPCFDDDIADKDHVHSIRGNWKRVVGLEAPAGESWSDSGIRVDVLRFRGSEPNWRPSLDGIVAECFANAYPDRWQSIESWLTKLPEPPENDRKQRMWAVMAGWFADKGCEAFLQHAIWNDAQFKDLLEQALDRLGITRAVEAMEAIEV